MKESLNELSGVEDCSRSYYCSRKFRYLKINFDSNTIYNCHAAKTQNIDFKWLESNSGNLFNTDINVAERGMMLENKRNSSCEPNCWQVEDKGSISVRMRNGGQAITHTKVRTNPEILEIALNSDCNLTCVYCCKEFSNSWRRDLLKNGDYKIGGDRYTLTNKEKLLLKVSQPELKSTKKYNILLNELRQISSGLKELIITGGEPLLDNRLIEILQTLNLSSECVIQLYTGLGVSNSRFIKVIDELSQFPNLILRVSSEATGKLLEFTRYGIRWTDFVEKIRLLTQHTVKFTFHSTISNLNVFGFYDFYNQFHKHGITLSWASQPEMMAVHVLDTDSKDMLKSQFNSLPDEYRLTLLKIMQATPTDKEKQDMKAFLFDFVQRRPDLDLNIYPSSFLEWLELKNVV